MYPLIAFLQARLDVAPSSRSLPEASSSVVVEGPQTRGVRWAGWSRVPTAVGRLVRQLLPGSIEAGSRVWVIKLYTNCKGAGHWTT
ncbi:hypothetical protein PRIPAC_86949 [Pristionchus pacificus]|uniref:Uncharacterized protein n=1 Tax=Pristionchus pacificus TaxID=54126 RepID=A0A2A6BNC5_PRIPA|nr:hypothetical protein PRIPAC_86949 [Pristionchus pacificus]|eukprot:PDM67338.1 hypothetical protein PRIPAC_48755 [Pristionchus pacificus]